MERKTRCRTIPALQPAQRLIMSTIWSIPVGVLLVSALFIFLINRGHINIGVSWFVSIMAGIFVWGWTISLYFRPDIPIRPLEDSVPGILEDAGVFIKSATGFFMLDGISFPYMLAVSTLTVFLLLTAPSYMDPQTAPRLWFFYLLIEAIGYLSVSANDVRFIIYGWVIFDLLDLTAQYVQTRPDQIRSTFLTAVGVRFTGTLLAVACYSLSNAEGDGNTGAFISLRAGVYLMIACAFRMGIIPISQPYSDKTQTRVGLGTMLRLASVLTVLPVLSRIPMGGLNPHVRTILGLASSFASLAGAVGWMLSEDTFSGISYAVLSISSMAFDCALLKEQSALIMWGVSIALTCAPLSLYLFRNRFLTMLVFLVLICFSGLPYTPNAIGWKGLTGSAGIIHNVVYVLIMAILIAGAIIHILRTEGRKFTDLEPWMRSIYPIGYLLAITTHMFISMTSYAERFNMGVLSASIPAAAAGIFAAVSFQFTPERRLTQNASAWGRAGLSVFWYGMQKLMNMDWLFAAGRYVSRAAAAGLRRASQLLENNGGLIWEFLLLALLIAYVFIGGNG